MQWLLTLAAILYSVAAVLLMVFVSSFGVLLAIYFRTRRRTPELPDVTDDALPSHLEFVAIR